MRCMDHICEKYRSHVSWWESKFKGNMELVNFESLPIDQPMTKVLWVNKDATGPINQGGPVEFLLDGTGGEFLDLENTKLYVKCHIVKPDGTSLARTDKIAFINLPLQSMWKQVDVYMQNRLVSSSGQLYPYKAYIDTLLNYGEDSKMSQLTTQMYATDTSSYFESFSSNAGWLERSTYTNESRLVDMVGPLYADVCQQPYLIPNGVAVKVRLVPSNPGFIINSPTVKGKLVLDEVKLQACMVTLNPIIYSQISSRLQKDTLKYPYTRAELCHHALLPGSTKLNLDNLFQGQIPSRIIVGLVSTKAMEGDYKNNPYNFQHFYLNYIDVSVDGVSLPRGPLIPDYPNKLYVNCYTTLFSGNWKEDFGNNIERGEYPVGNCIYVFDLDPSSLYDNLSPIKRGGNLKLQLGFAKALIESTQVIIYAQFPEEIHIDYSRNILQS